MKKGVWKIFTMICEGIVMSFAARIAAWAVLISVPMVWQLLGHMIGDLIFHVGGMMLGQ